MTLNRFGNCFSFEIDLSDLEIDEQDIECQVQSYNYSTACGGAAKETLTIQSSEELIADNTAEAVVDQSQQNLTFNDANPGTALEIPAQIDYVRMDNSQSIELGEFLSRPVLIGTSTWSEAGTIVDNFKPWSLYFNNAVIKRKLDNYYMLRCNLHVKLIINASPFYYGAALLSYNPLPAFSTDNVTGSFNITYSQRPHIWVYPQKSEGGTMTLPFLYHKTWLDCTSLADLEAMGELDLTSVGNLYNANGVAGESIAIQIYAWATDVEVAGPTTSLSLQAKDEYEDEGPVTKISSAVARYSGMLSDVPIVGPFATATNVVASAVNTVASWFGFTRVPNINDVQFFRAHPLPHFASTDIGEPIEKLTLDAKNELSIDPKISGVDMGDELLITSVVQRESYLTQFTWESVDSVGTDLFNMNVTPELLNVSTSANFETVVFTPMAYVAKMFSFWRGDIVVRFKFLCSQYHRGRVSITWDPSVSTWTTGLGTVSTTAYTQIVDLAESTDVEFRIPYTQPTAYLPTQDVDTNSNLYSSSGSAGAIPQANGNLIVKVLNKQTAPVASADILVNVLVRGAENMEFAGPRSLSDLASPYTIQSLETTNDASNAIVSIKSIDMGYKPSTTDDSINLIYMGECVKSLRSLMQRTTLYSTMVSDARTSNNSLQRVTSRNPRLPLYPGFDPNGIHEAVGLNDPLNDYPYNYVSWSALNWMSLCFVGIRGSICYYAKPMLSGEQVGTISIDRSLQLNTNNNETQETTTVNPYTIGRYFGVRYDGLNGLVTTHESSNACASASLPMYSRYKFMATHPDLRTNGSTIDGSDIDKVTIVSESVSGSTTGPPQAVQIYCKAGADLSLVFFKNAPVMYFYDSVPAAGTYP